MFTSCAEYRLVLRQDNADLRLMRYGNQLGLIENEMIHSLDEKEQLITEAVRVFAAKTVSPNGINDYLESNNSGKLSRMNSLQTLLKEMKLNLSHYRRMIASKRMNLLKNPPRPEAMNQIEIEIKYKGYIDRQTVQIESFGRNEEIKFRLTSNTRRSNHFRPRQLRKLSRIKPNSIGQALRIAGVRPSDISAIMIYMRG
ncbi:MAG: hypothetical protein IPG99_02725 [Ignavibacteria bacterium]|nr:hypothetical protein [Ignavibacteria bacterium]